VQKKQLKNAKITFSILLIFIGIVFITFNYFQTIKHNVFNNENIKLLEQEVTISEDITEVEETETVTTTEVITTEKVVSGKDDYIGYLEVPDVNIKRGFVALNSKYNSVSYNVMLIKGSTMPDEENSNLILAAHRGNSSVSFFNNLYKLNDGALAYVTYNNHKYTYKLVNRYEEPKDGSLTIRRNGEVRTLTLITCTRDNKQTQTVFIFEIVSID